MEDEVARFGRLFQAFMERMTQAAAAAQDSPVRDRLDRHLGVDHSTLPVLSQSFAPYDHVNVQVALTAYLHAEGRSYELVGLTGQQRHFESLSDLVQMANGMGIGIGSVDLVNLPVSPDKTLACVQFGLFLVRDHGLPLIVLMRGPTEFGPQQMVTLEVLSPAQDRASGLLAEVRRLLIERNVFRQQVISLGESDMGQTGLGPVVFHRRPALARDALVLPQGALDLVERQVLGIARQRDRLRASGQHVKRGLLLYGPPGNGKTLTVRYIVSQAPDHTVILLTAARLGSSAPPARWRGCWNPLWWCWKTSISLPKSAGCSATTATRCCSTCSTRWTAWRRTPTSCSSSPPTERMSLSQRWPPDRDASTSPSRSDCPARTPAAG
jgi:cell division protease FtsH